MLLSVHAERLRSVALRFGVERRRSAQGRAPLCMVARRNKPRLGGDTRWRPVLIAPADVPASVTLSGSPPKTAMLSRTQRRAAR